PNLNPSLTSVLINFRAHPVAVIADIAKAFLQISIRPEHRPYLRFLWYEHPSSINARLARVSVYEFRRLPFGVTSSPYILSAVIRRHLEHYCCTDAELVALIKQSL